MRILISAGEASGDLYASRVVEILKSRHPDWEFFGCAGPRMQAAGVEAVIDQRGLNVVGLAEVVPHIPRIYGLFRKLVASARERKPDLAILTDSAGFHLRVAKKLKALGIPIVYLIGPQAWAWRQGRLKVMRETLSRLLCIFPFEQPFFESHGIPTTFLGHPLRRMIEQRPRLSRAEFADKAGIDPQTPILALLPGSRPGEVGRHMPILMEAAARICARHRMAPLLAVPGGFNQANPSFSEPIRSQSINNIVRVVEGATWDALAYADVALAAIGTVAIEAALLGTPMVTFYRVNELTWYVGRRMVREPFLSMANMVNLVAGRHVVPALVQDQMTAERIAAEALRLIEDPAARAKMKADLAEVAAQFPVEPDPMEVAADWVERVALQAAGLEAAAGTR